MDWYYESGVNDLVVPKEQEPLDRLPSPNSWSLWGVSAPNSFKSPNKYFMAQKRSNGEEPNFNGKGLYEKVEMGHSLQEAENSSDSNLYQGFHDGSLEQATSPWGSQGYELSELARNNQADDIFMSSLLEEGPTDMDDIHGSFNLIPEFGYGVLPADNLLTAMVIDSDYGPSHLLGMGSSKYVKTHAFSPSTNWGHGEVGPCNLRQKDNTTIEALVARFAASSEVEMNGLVNEETTMEASILHDLEGVMIQFSEKTRICFRDAFYRLAKNSVQHMENHSQSGDNKLPQCTVHDETSRLENTKTAESETNSVDRAVAHLLFSKLDSEQESNGTTEQRNYSSSQSLPPPHYYSQHTSLSGDTEVPIFSKGKPPAAGEM